MHVHVKHGRAYRKLGVVGVVVVVELYLTIFKRNLVSEAEEKILLTVIIAQTVLWAKRNVGDNCVLTPSDNCVLTQNS